MVRGGVPAAAALIALMMHGSLAAAAPRAKKPTVSQEAAARLKSGTELFTAGDFSGALVQFRAAQRAAPSWEVLYDIGRCERRLEKFGDALRDLQSYLSQGGAKVPADRKDAVAKELAEVRAASVAVTITVPGAPAGVSIDGEPVGKSPFGEPFVLAPGKKLFWAKREGERPAERTEELKAGTQVTVVLNPSLKGVGPIELALESTPKGAVVSVDGKPAGTTPLTVDVEPGEHLILAEANGYRPCQQAVTVEEGKKQAIHFQMELEVLERKSRSPVVGIVVGGAGVLAIGGAVALNLSAQSRAREVNGLFATGGTWDAYYDAVQARGQREEAWSLAAGLCGGAALVTGAILTLVNLTAEPPEGELETVPTETKEEEAAPVEGARIFVAPVSGGGLYGGLSFRW